MGSKPPLSIPYYGSSISVEGVGYFCQRYNMRMYTFPSTGLHSVGTCIAALFEYSLIKKESNFQSSGSLAYCFASVEDVLEKSTQFSH